MKKIILQCLGIALAFGCSAADKAAAQQGPVKAKPYQQIEQSIWRYEQRRVEEERERKQAADQAERYKRKSLQAFDMFMQQQKMTTVFDAQQIAWLKAGAQEIVSYHRGELSELQALHCWRLEALKFALQASMGSKPQIVKIVPQQPPSKSDNPSAAADVMLPHAGEGE